MPFSLSALRTAARQCARLAGLPLIAAASLAATAIGADAAEVKLDARPGQAAMLAGKGGRLYVRIGLEGIAAPREGGRTPVNIAIVIDRSGSMRGVKMARAKEAAIMALGRLGPDDVVSVIAYNHEIETIIPARHLTRQGELRARIHALRADGRTALHAGVSQGIREVRKYLAPERVNRVILLSDGLANVGPSTPEALGRLGREAVAEGISITTIGLGLGYNEDLMAKLAYNSDGNHAFVERADDLVKVFNQEFGDVLSVVAQDVIIEIEVTPGFAPRRVLGREARIDGRRVRLRLNQLYGGQEKYVLLELDAPAEARLGERTIARVSLSYRSMRSGERERLSRPVRIAVTDSAEKARASIDKTVMTAVTTQIANITSERAVRLRDKGKLREAKALLERNAAFLAEKARELNASALHALSKRYRADAENLSAGKWRRARKAMRARQHKLKVQQAY